MLKLRTTITMTTLALLASAAPVQAEQGAPAQPSAVWERVAPGVWTRTLDGWTAIHVKRSEGEAWLRARLEQELERARARRAARPRDSRPAWHVASLQERIAQLDASASRVGRALEADAPSPDLPPSNYCWYVDGAVGPRSFGGYPGASATGVASSCSSSDNYVRVDACDSYHCVGRSAFHPYKAQAYTDVVGSGPRGCAGESYADNGEDVFWLTKYGFACW